MPRNSVTPVRTCKSKRVHGPTRLLTVHVMLSKMLIGAHLLSMLSNLKTSAPELTSNIFCQETPPMHEPALPGTSTQCTSGSYCPGGACGAPAMLPLLLGRRHTWPIVSTMSAASAKYLCHADCMALA